MDGQNGSKCRGGHRSISHHQHIPSLTPSTPHTKHRAYLHNMAETVENGVANLSVEEAAAKGTSRCPPSNPPPPPPLPP